MPRVKASAARGRRVPPVPALPDRPSRLRVILRRQRRMLRPALAVAALGGAGLGFLVLLQAFGNGASLHERLGHVTARMGLRVRQVRVEGRQKTPEGLLRAALGVSPGDPLLALSLDDARARIESIKWVQSATVQRHLPDTLVVSLIERRPFAVWQHDGKFVLIDRDGAVVTDSDVAAFAGQLPLVVGNGAPQEAAALLDVLATQPAVAPRVVAAVRVGERRWNLRMNNGADVLLPEDNVPQALARLADLQSQDALLDRPLQVIDLRLPDRLAVRARADRGADPLPVDGGKDAGKTLPAAARRPT